MTTPIIAPPSAPFVVVRTNALLQSCSAWYERALVALWRAGLDTGVDPVVLAAQCAHETGWGRFGGAVTADFGNTCGLKTLAGAADTPSDHAQFAIDPDGIPWVGALAHAHHLMLYAGHPVPLTTPDPRAVLISPGNRHFGSAPYVEDLSGKWAPSSTYGKRVADLVKRLRLAPPEV